MLCISESDSCAAFFCSYTGGFGLKLSLNHNTDILITFPLYERFVTKALDILTSLERLLYEFRPVVCLQDIDSALEMITSVSTRSNSPENSKNLLTICDCVSNGLKCEILKIINA